MRQVYALFGVETLSFLMAGLEALLDGPKVQRTRMRNQEAFLSCKQVNSKTLGYCLSDIYSITKTVGRTRGNHSLGTRMMVLWVLESIMTVVLWSDMLKASQLPSIGNVLIGY